VKGFPITDDINGCRAGDDGVENPATGFREKANRYSRFVSGCAPFRNPVAAGVDMEVVLPYCLLKIPAKIEEYIEFLPSYFAEAAIASSTSGCGFHARNSPDCRRTPNQGLQAR
jgi:hypothetical protein